MIVHFLTFLIFAVAVSSSICARMTRPDRNYYPMQRVLWTVLGFVYGGSALARLFQPAPVPNGRLALSIAFSLAVLTATTYSIFFMRRRNKVPRFVPGEEVEALRARVRELERGEAAREAERDGLSRTGATTGTNCPN